MARDIAMTRRALHAVAELVLAGPQYRSQGTIRLRVTPGGFGTVAGPDVRVDGLVVTLDSHRCALHGRTPAELASSLGLTASRLDEVYPDGSGVGLDEVLAVAPDAAARIAAAFSAGDEALRLFAPAARRTLWPEHFDLGITVGEVNYGVSAGDDRHEQPYAYVGPHVLPAGGFWNEPFGASIPIDDDPDVAVIIDFFRAGAAAATG